MMQNDDFDVQSGIILKYKGIDATVVVPDGIIGISFSAFWESDVEEIILPEGLTWLAGQAFARCPNLRRLVLPSTLRIVPSLLCSDCSALEEVVIPEGVVILRDSAFKETGLRSVTIPGSVRSVGYSCFGNCRKLRTVTLNEGLQVLESSAFCQCRNLRSISLPASVRFIQYNAFHGCSRLEAVHMEAGLLSVGFSAFGNCPRLKAVDFPDTLEDLDFAPFGDVPNLERLTFLGNRVDLEESSDLDSVPVIRAPRLLPEWIPSENRPAALAGYRELKADGMSFVPEMEAAWEAFAAGEDPDESPVEPTGPFYIADGVLYRSTCKEGRVVVPDGVVGIQQLVFFKSDIREIWIPDSVQWIHSGAFSDCSQLEAVRLPAGLTRISEGLFDGCRSLKSIRIPGSVKVIGERAFAKSGLETIALPSSLETIEEEAFLQCSELKQVTFPEGLHTIRESAFSECGSLAELSLPDSLEILEENAFENCTALERIHLGTGLRQLEQDTFQACSSLREVFSSADLCTIEEDCFPSCDQPIQITLEAAVLVLESQEATLKIVAPNADPSPCLTIDALRPLLLSFISEDGKGFRCADRYLELLSWWKEEIWDSEEFLRFLLDHNLLEEEDIEECLKDLLSKELPDLANDVLDYRHRRFPELVLSWEEDEDEDDPFWDDDDDDDMPWDDDDDIPWGGMPWLWDFD